MKKLISFLAFCSILTLFAQTNFIEVVHLKNGNKVKGVILEQVPNENIKIQSEDGSTFVFKYSEIEKITKEPINNLNSSNQPSNKNTSQNNSYSIKSGNNGTIASGTPLIIKLTNTISSANTDEPMFVIAGDVKDPSGKILISDGTQIITETKINKRKAIGRPGSIEIKFISTSASDGQLITLNGSKSYIAADKKGKVIGISVGVGVGLFILPMLAYLAKKGDDVVITSGTMLSNSAIVLGTYNIQ